jgi:hypothetical protein
MLLKIMILDQDHAKFDLRSPDRKVDVYLMSNFEPKYVINLCPRLKLFWAH